MRLRQLRGEPDSRSVPYSAISHGRTIAERITSQPTALRPQQPLSPTYDPPPELKCAPYVVLIVGVYVVQRPCITGSNHAVGETNMLPSGHTARPSAMPEYPGVHRLTMLFVGQCAHGMLRRRLPLMLSWVGFHEAVLERVAGLGEEDADLVVQEQLTLQWR
jgi:hypothetical protein